VTTAVLESAIRSTSPKGSNKSRRPRNDRRNKRPSRSGTEMTPKSEKLPIATAGYYAWRVDLNEPANDAATGFIQRPGMSSAIRFYVAHGGKGKHSVIGNWIYDMVEIGQLEIA
jgi:hypothetical protein